MELSNEHRKHLLNELQNAVEQSALLVKFRSTEQSKIDGNTNAKPRDPFMMASIEMDEFLNQQRIITIKNALIENEIDF